MVVFTKYVHFLWQLCFFVLEHLILGTVCCAACWETWWRDLNPLCTVQNKKDSLQDLYRLTHLTQCSSIYQLAFSPEVVLNKLVLVIFPHSNPLTKGKCDGHLTSRFKYSFHTNITTYQEDLHFMFVMAATFRVRKGNKIFFPPSQASAKQ